MWNISFDLQVKSPAPLDKLRTVIAALKEQNKPKNVAQQTEFAALKEQNASESVALQTVIAVLTKQSNKSENAALQTRQTEIAEKAS